MNLLSPVGMNFVAERAPKTIEEYAKWMQERHGAAIDASTRSYYDTVAAMMKLRFESSPFWQELTTGALRRFDEEYRLAHDNYPLLVSVEMPVIVVKTYDSFLEKTFRINCIQNTSFPQPPFWLGEKGWVLPNNWLSRINDVIRTRIVVKYFDGVRHVANGLTELSKKHSLPVAVSWQAKDEGYYAAHVNVTSEFEVVSRTWDTEKVTSNVEVQVTTQLQHAVAQMLHKYYEGRRVQPPPPRDYKWQWDNESNFFSANYLGHILHYLEGMIVELRDKAKGG